MIARLLLWTDPAWWTYLFERPRHGWRRADAGILDTLWCRARGHPAGPIFYNAGGLEPDDRCKNCGDHLG